jgi:drug/metabolite transporter (DMT)-like permease
MAGAGIGAGIVLGLGSGVAFGAGDFSAGVATRRATGIAVTAGVQAIGFAVLLVVLALVHPAVPDSGYLLAGAAAGIAGAIGAAALFQGLSMGAMGIVAAISGSGAVTIPLAASFLVGARIAPLQIVGVVCTAGAAAAASGTMQRGVPARALGLGGLAALGFGAWYVLLNQAAKGDPTWALVVNRAAGAAFMGSVAWFSGRLPELSGPWRPVLASGLFDLGGNALFVLSGQALPVGLAAALSGLYPLVTTILARIVLREHMPRLATVAVGMAIVGIVLISVGRPGG